MFDIAVAYNRFKFLGHEFLTWLWYVIDNAPETFRTVYPHAASLHIGDRIVLERRHNGNIESITIKGDQADLREAMLALRKGALVTELNLVFRSDPGKWRFTLKGESLGISALQIPETGPFEQKDEMEAAILEKLYLIEHLCEFTERLFKSFVTLRLTPQDWQDTSGRIRHWMQSSSKH